MASIYRVKRADRERSPYVSSGGNLISNYKIPSAFSLEEFPEWTIIALCAVVAVLIIIAAFMFVNRTIAGAEVNEVREYRDKIMEFLRSSVTADCEPIHYEKAFLLSKFGDRPALEAAIHQIESQYSSDIEFNGTHLSARNPILPLKCKRIKRVFVYFLAMCSIILIPILFYSIKLTIQKRRTAEASSLIIEEMLRLPPNAEFNPDAFQMSSDPNWSQIVEEVEHDPRIIVLKKRTGKTWRIH